MHFRFSCERRTIEATENGKRRRVTALQLYSWIIAAIILALPPRQLSAQVVQGVASGGLRPFVIGFEPVVGPNGAVGGVAIDADGVIARAEREESARLREARGNALLPVSREIAATSKLRKVSLRRLEATVAQRLNAKEPLTDEMLLLAGLQRAEYVFVYPEQNDVVLAGYAEGWKLDEQGTVVGQTTKRPVLRLDDLIVALRAAEATLHGERISCSIDPTEDGLRGLTRLLDSPGLQVNESTVARLEETLGPQQVTVTGVPADSHFARVLVSADFMMKRLAMNFERSPVAGMPSYLELLQAASGRPPRNAAPRWWMAVNYEPLLRSDDGLAWQLRGQGVRTLTEDGFVRADGTVRDVGKPHPLAQKWADTMTDKFDALAERIAVFGELRNCTDLAVMSALIVKQDLLGVAGFEATWFLDPAKLAVATYPVPKQVGSRASLIRKGRQWIISVSGGVDVDVWPVLEHAESSPRLEPVRAAASTDNDQIWWWD